MVSMTLLTIRCLELLLTTMPQISSTSHWNGSVDSNAFLYLRRLGGGMGRGPWASCYNGGGWDTSSSTLGGAGCAAFASAWAATDAALHSILDVKRGFVAGLLGCRPAYDVRDTYGYYILMTWATTAKPPQQRQAALSRFRVDVLLFTLVLYGLISACG